MPNFDFLKNSKEFSMFAASAVEAEKVFASSPAMCVIGCRKALELAVKWVYAVDKSIQEPYKDTLSALIHKYNFKKQLPDLLFNKIKGIVTFGNIAVHTSKTVPSGFAVQALKTSLSSFNGSIIPTAKTIRFAHSTSDGFPKRPYPSTCRKSGNRKVCWGKKMRK